MDTNASGNTLSTSGLPGNPDGAFDRASSSAHAAVNSLAGAADDAVRKAKPTIDKVAAMAHQAVDKAAGVAAPTADWLAAQGKSLTGAQKRMMESTCSYVSANPMKSVGIALVAGILLSRIILR